MATCIPLLRTALVLLLALAPAARADLGDADTWLGEISIDELQVAPDGSRLAFITRGNDFAHDREVFTVWLTPRPHTRKLCFGEAEISSR